MSTPIQPCRIRDEVDSLIFFLWVVRAAIDDFWSFFYVGGRLGRTETDSPCGDTKACVVRTTCRHVPAGIFPRTERGS